MQSVLVVLNCSFYSTGNRFPLEFAELASENTATSLEYLLLLPDAEEHVLVLARQLFANAIIVEMADDFVLKYKHQFQYAVVVESDQGFDANRFNGVLDYIVANRIPCCDAGIRIVLMRESSEMDTFESLLYAQPCLKIEEISNQSSLYANPVFVVAALETALPEREYSAIAEFIHDFMDAFEGRCEAIQAWHHISRLGPHVFRLLKHEQAEELAESCRKYLETKIANPYMPEHTCTLYNQQGLMAWSYGGYFREGTQSDVFAAFEELQLQNCDFLYYIREPNAPERSLHQLLAYVLNMRLIEADLADFVNDDEAARLQHAFYQDVYYPEI